MEYSGYGYANPAGAESGISPIANLLGFAVVDVNMRGTGCSGGAYDYFERLQSLDGYDVIETVVRQPWVLGHRVGMTGISYGGISQLFVAATDPPHLAAITPLSVIDSTITTLYPGGILNTGFALTWGKERAHDALPASPSGGQPWALKRIRGGDRTCAANQALHGEATNLIATIRHNSHYDPAVADPLDPVTFVHRITAPTYLACQWEDEQTGGHCADLAQHLTGTRRAWFTFTNGAHIDSLDPATFNRWYDFLELNVAHRRPSLSDATRSACAPRLPDDVGDLRRDAAARSNSVRALLRGGARRLRPPGADPGPVRQRRREPGAGRPVAGLRAIVRPFSDPRHACPLLVSVRPAAAWPRPPPARARPIASPGARTPAPPRASPVRTTAPRAACGRPPRAIDWHPNPPGTAAAYVTAPLAANTAVIGGGAVHLWIKASAPSVDLQATVSEVRPDGHETFVQNGWLRADERALDLAHSTLLQPVPSLRAADVTPLPRGRYTEVTVPLYFEGHVYRRNSRIRLTISAPGGDQPVWAFCRDHAASPGHGEDRGRPVDALATDPPGRARRQGADRPAALPGPARGAMPDVHAVCRPHGARFGLGPGRGASPGNCHFHAAIRFSR